MTTPRWLTREQQTAWVQLAAVMELLPRALDAQLERDQGLTHFDYFTLAMLSEAEHRTLRMTTLAGLTAATLPRLSRVINKLADLGLVERRPCPGDRRATNVVLTDRGWQKVVAAAPGHVDTVRTLVVDPLTDDQVTQLREITTSLLRGLDPESRMVATYR